MIARVAGSSDCQVANVVVVGGASLLSWCAKVEKRLSVFGRPVVRGAVGTPTSFSSRASSFTGSPGLGSRDNKSGASLNLPGTCIVLKSKFDSCNDQRVNLEFLSFALCSHVSAALSVKSSKRRVSR